MLGIDWQAGRIAWTFEDPDRQFPFMASAAITKDAVIVGGRDKHLHRGDVGSLAQGDDPLRIWGQDEGQGLLQAQAVEHQHLAVFQPPLDLLEGRRPRVEESGLPLRLPLDP